VSGNLLVLQDGAYEARFSLGGASATAYAVRSDDHGGTLITAATLMTQAIAAFAPAFAAPAVPQTPSAAAVAHGASANPLAPKHLLS
jgi:hypothetical protein